MTEPIDKINTKYVAVTKDQQFEKGDIITFVFIGSDDQLKNVSQNNLMGLVDRVEGRYVSLIFSHTPVKDGVIAHMSLDTRMTVKMNGYSKMSLLGENGVLDVELPLADVVNHDPSIIIKNMLERVK